MNRATLIQSAALRWAQHHGKDLAGLAPDDQTQLVQAVCKTVRGVTAIEAREALLSLWTARNEVQGQGARLGTEVSGRPLLSDAPRDMSRSPLGVMLSARTMPRAGDVADTTTSRTFVDGPRVPTSALLLPPDPHRFAVGLSGEDVPVHLGSMNHMRLPSGTPLVALLTPQGEKAVAASSPADFASLAQEFADAEARSPGKAQRNQNLSVTLAWNDENVERIFIPRAHFREFMSLYRQGISQGVLPKQLGEVPYTRFFVASDDIDADLRAAEMRRRNSSFAARSPESQKATAALAHRAASEAPKSVPYPLRLAVYDALIRHERMPLAQSPHAQRFYEIANEEKKSASPFHHGTRDAASIAQEGFRPGENNLMGKGIYYGNPSVAAQYANRGPASRKLEHEQIISGRVLAGETTTGRLPLNDFVQSAIEPMPMEGGSYHVTREAERFQMRGVTTLDPALAHESLRDFLPELLALCAHAPDAAAWAGRFLDAFAEDELRAASQNAKGAPGTSDVKLGTAIVLLTRGDPGALSDVDGKSLAQLPAGAQRCILGASVDASENAQGDAKNAIHRFWNRCGSAELDLAIAERMNSPMTFELAKGVLKNAAEPNSVKRVLAALREQKSVSVPSIRSQVASFHDEAKAKILFELGRTAELRPLLHDAAEIESQHGETNSAIELLLRNSQELNDSDFKKWSNVLGKKSPQELERIAFQLCAKDNRWESVVLDALRANPETSQFDSFCRTIKGSAYQAPALGLGIAALEVGLPDEKRNALFQSLQAGLESAGPDAISSSETQRLKTVLASADANLQEQFKRITAR